MLFSQFITSKKVLENKSTQSLTLLIWQVQKDFKEQTQLVIEQNKEQLSIKV
jgi:hypothetical protein